MRIDVQRFWGFYTKQALSKIVAWYWSQQANPADHWMSTYYDGSAIHTSWIHISMKGIRYTGSTKKDDSF
jgi:hypothetical protein